MRWISGTQTTIPSWSWMAFEGGIEHLKVGFGAEDSRISLLFPKKKWQSNHGLYVEQRERLPWLNWEDVNEYGPQLTFDGETQTGATKHAPQNSSWLWLGVGSVMAQKNPWIYVLVGQLCPIGSVYERVGFGRVYVYSK